jgi:hypothetical protein
MEIPNKFHEFTKLCPLKLFIPYGVVIKVPSDTLACLIAPQLIGANNKDPIFEFWKCWIIALPLVLDDAAVNIGLPHILTIR